MGLEVLGEDGALGLIHTVVYVAEIQTQYLGTWLPKNWGKTAFGTAGT